jgi:hypothetical protein
MLWDDRLSALLQLLVRQYPDPNVARNVAQRAGLQIKYLHVGGDPDSVWMAVLGQARDSHTGLEDLAREAQKDFPNIDFLTLAHQALNDDHEKSPIASHIGDFSGMVVSYAE